jgi:biotin carboxyl carrier protein
VRVGGVNSGPQKLNAPMPGKVVRILVAVGDEVKAGQGIIVMEAMNMQNEMKSPKDGKVQKILTSEGSTVNPGDTLAVIE